MSRICDRCGGKNIREKFVSKLDGAEIDLCAECKEAFQEFLDKSTEPRRPGRPPKEK